MSDESQWEAVSSKIDTWYLQCRNVSEWTEMHDGKQPIPEEMRDELHNLGGIVFGMLDGVPQPKKAGEIWLRLEKFKSDWDYVEKNDLPTRPCDWSFLSGPSDWEMKTQRGAPTKGRSWQPIGNQSGSWEVK